MPNIVWSCIFLVGPKKADAVAPLKRKSGLFYYLFRRHLVHRSPHRYTICNLLADHRSSPFMTSIASGTPGIASPLFYGRIAVCFNCVLNCQTVFAIAWVVLTKWLTIGRRLRQGQVQLLRVPLWVLSTYTLTRSSYRPARSVVLVSVKTAQRGIW